MKSRIAARRQASERAASSAVGSASVRFSRMVRLNRMLSCHATAYDCSRLAPVDAVHVPCRQALTVPEVGRSIPVMSFAIVDLPLPLRPTIAVTTPCRAR